MREEQVATYRERSAFDNTKRSHKSMANRRVPRQNLEPRSGELVLAVRAGDPARSNFRTSKNVDTSTLEGVNKFKCSTAWDAKPISNDLCDWSTKGEATTCSHQARAAAHDSILGLGRAHQLEDAFFQVDNEERAKQLPLFARVIFGEGMRSSEVVPNSFA